MKLIKIISLSLAGLLTALSSSCGTLPELPKQTGPQSSESEKPWNVPRQGEGQGQFGGLGAR